MSEASCTWCQIDLPDYMMDPHGYCPGCHATFEQALAKARKREPYDVPQHARDRIEEVLLPERQKAAEKREQALAQALEQRREAEERAQRVKAAEAELKARHEEEVKRKEEEQERQRSAKELARKELARRALASKHLLPFVKYTMPGYNAGWVHKDICRRLERFSEQVARGESPRLMLAMPPRHGKSLIASQMFPAWHLARYPKDDVITVSYSAALATDFSKKVRALVKSPEYSAIFPKAGIDPDNQNAEGWSTNKGGMYVPAGVGGPITGRGAHCVSSHLSVTTRRGTILANQVTVGEEVLGYDHDTGRAVWTIVRAVSTTRKPELVRIGSLVCTPDHRVWTDLRGYVQAARVQPEDDLVGVCALREGVRAEAQGSPEGAAAQSRPEQSAEDVLLPSLCTRRAGDWRQEDLSKLRWGEGIAREDVQLLLRGGTGDTHGASGVLPMQYGVHSPVRGVGEVEDPARGARQGVLRPGLLSGVSTHELVCEQGAEGRVPELRGADLSAQAAEILLPQMLYGLSEEAGESELHGIPGRLAPAPDGGPAPRPHMPAVHEVRDAGGAPYRPRRDEQRADQPDRPVPDVPLFISCESGVCAGDLEAGLYGPGFDVVDLQTDTSNFFAGETLVHNCMIIDDPVKNAEEAESSIQRQSIKEWYASTAYTRLAPGGGVLIVQTRWHEDDLSGWLLTEMEQGNGDEWEVIKYPAIAIEDEPYRKVGEALHPERFSLSTLLQTKRTVGRRVWQALYQQDPVGEEGDFFQGKDFQYYRPADLPPLEDLTIYAAWDLAIGTREHNDFTVGVVFGIDRSMNLWMLDLYRGRWGSLEIIDKLFECYDKWQPSIMGIERTHVEQAIGPLITEQKRRRNKYGMRIEPLKPGRRDKQARAQPIRGLIEMHRVYFPKIAPWLDDFISELLKFPNGKHDDCVDGIAWIGQMIEMFNPRPVLKEKPKKSWRDQLKKYVSEGGVGRSHMAS